jgi:hypothetical protein
MTRITDDQARLDLLPRLFGPDFLRVETAIYDRAQCRRFIWERKLNA